MGRRDLSDLQTSQTPKERLRNFSWAALSVIVSCAISWDLSVYLIGFWESGRISKLVVSVILAIALAWTLRLSSGARQHWWPVVPVIVALIVPIGLHATDRGVQPNSRLLSDTYESALRATSGAPKPER
jgi:hypothetical protein